MDVPTLTLWSAYVLPGQPFDRRVRRTTVPADKIIYDFKEIITDSFRVAEKRDDIGLYKVPDLPLRDMHTSLISFSDLGNPLTFDEPLATVFPQQPAQSYLHLMLVEQGMPMSVRSWFRDADTAPLEIEVPRLGAVNQLLAAITERRTDLGLSTRHVKLYKFSYHDHEQLVDILHTNGEGVLLQWEQVLQDAFIDIPLDRKPCVIVEVADRVLKRPRSMDPIDRVLQQPRIAPSQLTPSEYHRRQANLDTRYYDQRNTGTASLPDETLPPVEVLYPGFGHFLDTYHAQRDKDCTGGSAALRENVELFAQNTSKIYEKDIHRQDAGLFALNKIFGCLSGTIEPTVIDGAITDGLYAHGPFRIPCIVIEFKNECGTTVPIAQLCGYYERLTRGVAIVAEGRLFKRSRLPTLGLTIVGPVITFWAILSVGPTVYSNLTPGISCVPRGGGGDDLRALHAAFIAAVELLTRIEEDARKISDTFSPLPLIADHRFPDIQELPSIRDPDSVIVFNIINILHAGSNRVLYRASSPDHKYIIKITHSYSVDLHRFCADRGHAPALFACKRLPGNIIVVAMDYVEGVQLESHDPQVLRDSLGQQLKRLAEEFHREGYVHGDLRLPNILRVDDTVKLLDFDWGGKVGEAFYPPCRLNPQPSEGRDMDNLMITQDDDERVLKSTLMSIGCS